MPEAWVAHGVVAALALAWRLGLAMAPAGLLASAGSAVGLRLWQATRLVRVGTRAVPRRDRSDAGLDEPRG